MTPVSEVQPQTIVHRRDERLLSPKVPFLGLDRGIPEQQLDLLQIAAGLADS